jgi:oligo-1,6-glucosidase
VFAYYQRLIALRHEEDVVAVGDLTMLEAEHPTLYAYERSHGRVRLLVVGNVSGEELEVPLLAEWGDATLVLSNLGATVDGGPAHQMAAWEVRVYRAR